MDVLKAAYTRVIDVIRCVYSDLAHTAAPLSTDVDDLENTVGADPGESKSL